MSTHNRIGNKVPKYIRTEEESGARIDPGPHIGIIKHVYDQARTGRLQVFIPFLGGDPENPNNQAIVQYASPFFGHTNLQMNPNGQANEKTEFETVRHTYGMWMTPPDVGVRVLLTFVNGNPNHGFWFACIPPALEHNMAGSSGGVAVSDITKDAEIDALISGYSPSYAPATEYNAAAAESFSTNAGLQKKAPHRIQTKILAEQGLLADPARGIDAATSVRESPSGCFGITTPGRIYQDQVTDDLLHKIDKAVDLAKLKEIVNTGRKGGHQFTMDDGDDQGESRRIKLRSAAGHQIVMDDTSGMLYISNSTGTNWIELTNDGQMLIYSESDISVRTGGDLNVKVDGDLNTEVNGNYNLKVRGDTKTETTNKEEVVTGNKDVDITGHYHTTVTDTISIEAIDKISIQSTDDIAIGSLSGIGIDAGSAINLAAGAASGWKAGGALQFEADSIGLNSGPPGSPAAVFTPTVPEPFTLADLNDTAKAGDIWKHEQASTSTGQTMLPKITTHEPYDSRSITPLVSLTGKPSKGV
jgi:hypothetical protein